MPKPFRYTPYAGPKAPFSIGLEPLDASDWIEVDGNLPRYLAEKSVLFAEQHDKVFRARDGTVDAQQEVLELLADFLPKRYPQIYRAAIGAIEIVPTGTCVALDADSAPLERAAHLVQDDLVIMRKGSAGYELAAGAVCFPSSWRLEDKFGLPLEAIHGPVPGYQGRMARRMDVIFDRLPHGGIVWRSNWSIYDSDRLPAYRSSNGLALDGAADFDAAFLRVERQTLRRLPRSGDLLFTIMIYVDPLSRLREHPDAARLAAGLRRQLMALDDGQLKYKSLTERRAGLAEYLQAIIDGRTAPAAPS